MDDEKLKRAVRTQWDFRQVIRDLRRQKWRGTEPERIDRMLWLGDEAEFEKKTKATFGLKEWKSAANDGMQGELVSDYMEALAEVLSEAMKEHVYVMFHNGEVYAGQYEDIPADALRAMGFEIEGRKLSGSKDAPDNPFNEIGHASDWDGTLRSYKALSAIERYYPKNPGDIARIWIEDRNTPADVYQIEFPMFLETPMLVEFVTEAIKDQNYERYFNYYVTHWDLTDSVADMWKLSPYLKLHYPGHREMFNGVNIGEGWHELLRKVRYILDQV